MNIPERLNQIRSAIKANIEDVVSTMPAELQRALEMNIAPYKVIQEEDVPLNSSLLYLLFFILIHQH